MLKALGLVFFPIKHQTFRTAKNFTLQVCCARHAPEGREGRHEGGSAAPADHPGMPEGSGCFDSEACARGAVQPHQRGKRCTDS